MYNIKDGNKNFNVNRLSLVWELNTNDYDFANEFRL